MGSGTTSRQGLYIKKRVVTFTPDSGNPNKGKLIKYSEIRMLLDDFRYEADAANPYAQPIHDHGLMIGMSFQKAHKPAVAWAAAAPDHSSPTSLSYTSLLRDSGIESILNGMFKTDGTWFGYVIQVGNFPSGNNIMYIRTTIDPFITNHKRDVHFVPVLVAIGTDGDFASHYAAGIATFTQGEGFFTFDSQILQDA